MIVIFAVISLDTALNIIDGAFAMMAIPTSFNTMVSAESDEFC